MVNCPYKEPKPSPCPENINERVEWSLGFYDHLMKQSEWLDDDRIPYLHVYTGTRFFAEAFGCRIHQLKNGNAFTLPLITGANEVSEIKVPELGSSTLTLAFDVAEKLRAKACTDAVLRIPDMQSPIDIAAMIWDNNSFYIALIDEPEAVLELIGKVKQLVFAFLDEWFLRYGKEYIAHYPDYYMHGGITISEDEVGIISGDMFLKYCLPYLIEISERYGGLGMHCCANAKHQWENFKKIPGLRLLNFVQPKDILRQAYGYFSGTAAQMHTWCGDGDISTWPANYPANSRVVIQASAKTRDEALALCEKLKKACGRN